MVLQSTAFVGTLRDSYTLSAPSSSDKQLNTRVVCNTQQLNDAKVRLVIGLDDKLNLKNFSGEEEKKPFQGDARETWRIRQRCRKSGRALSRLIRTCGEARLAELILIYRRVGLKETVGHVGRYCETGL